MHPGSFRSHCLVVGASYVLLAAGCSQFSEAECATEACDGTSGSTTEPSPTSSLTTSTTNDSTTTNNGTTSDSGITSDNGTTTNDDTTTSDGTTTPDGTTTATTSPATETTAGPQTDTGNVDPFCGDGVIDGTETCDDENTVETDGCLSTCVVPASCAIILSEVPGLPSEAYDIFPDGDLLRTACDMTTEGGGWTLVAKVNNADVDGVSEPLGWFGAGNNPANLASPDLILNEGLESHGAGRFSPLITAGASLTRFELIEGGNVTESIQWFKVVETTASFEAWFSETDPNGSTVCTDVALTDDCESGRIQTMGSEGGNATVLGGMRSITYFPDAFSSPIVIRQDNNASADLSGMLSQTTDVEEWSQGYRTQSGNGLRIWLRE